MTTAQVVTTAVLPPSEQRKGAEVHVTERFETKDGVTERVVTFGGESVRTQMGEATPGAPTSLDAQADFEFLRATERPAQAASNPVRSFDLYSGCGGLSLGLGEASRALGRGFVPVAALDASHYPLSVFGRNFPEARLIRADASRLFGEGESSASWRERAVARHVGDIDWLLAGPPCQGYSSLNHDTRGTDPRNGLYERVARAARVLEPRHVLIENVISVRADESGAVSRTVEALARQGYTVEEGFVDLADIGVPQLRRRHLVLATTGVRSPRPRDIVLALKRPRRTVRWAIHDLATQTGKTDFDKASKPSAVNSARMGYLLRHSLYDLPNAERPPCQQADGHSYRSMYGRLRWDAPAQTITSGYGSMGQGRYVHPDGGRTLTPHEAARLQFFPDWFEFGAAARTEWADAIGNAAPMKLSYVAALWLMS